MSSRPPRRPRAEPPSGWRLYWRGMGLWRWLSLGLIALSLVLTPLTCMQG